MGLLIDARCRMLDAEFPAAGANHAIEVSTNGTDKHANIPALAIGASGWAAATNAEPPVKANNALLVTDSATGPVGQVTHYRVLKGGVPVTGWEPLDEPQTVNAGGKLEFAIGAIRVRLLNT